MLVSSLPTVLYVRLGGYRITQENHMTVRVTTTQVRSGKGSPEFRERMAQVVHHVAEFQPAELQLVAAAAARAAEFEPNGVSVSEHGSAV